MLAALRYLLTPIALCYTYQTRPVLLKFGQIRIHTTRRGRSERPRSHACGCFGSPCIVNRMLSEILWQRLPLLQCGIQTGVRNVAGHHYWTAQRQTRPHGIARKLTQQLGHGSIQIDVHRCL